MTAAASWCYLTDAGRAARDDAIATLQPVFPLLFSEFSDAEFAAALPFLERLRKFLDENRDAAAPGDPG